jgi:hypothetical protein
MPLVESFRISFSLRVYVGLSIRSCYLALSLNEVDDITCHLLGSAHDSLILMLVSSGRHRTGSVRVVETGTHEAKRGGSTTLTGTALHKRGCPPVRITAIKKKANVNAPTRSHR